MILILFIVCMLLWMLSLFPVNAQLIRSSGLLAFVCVLLLFFLVHGLRL